MAGGAWDEYQEIENGIYYGLSSPEMELPAWWYPATNQLTLVFYLYSRREEAGGKFSNAVGPADMNENYLNPIARTFTISVALPETTVTPVPTGPSGMKPVVTKGINTRPVQTPTNQPGKTSVSATPAGPAQGKTDLPAPPAEEQTDFYDIPIKEHDQKIIFILDTSFSMGVKNPGKGVTQSKLDLAKAELKETLTKLDKKVWYNLIAYNEVAVVWSKNFICGESDKKKEEALNWLATQSQTEQYTNTYESLEKAFLLIGPGQKAVIFLVTDGRPNRGKHIKPEEILSVVKKLNGHNKIVINTIGVWLAGVADPHETEELREQGEEFLKALAEQNGGTFVKK